MSSQPPDETAAETLRCPVCRAVQAWSDTCRRCKCDLGLVLSVLRSCRQVRRRCLDALRHGRFSDALGAAREAYQLNPDADAAGLLAMCYLLHGDLPAAFAVGGTLSQQP